MTKGKGQAGDRACFRIYQSHRQMRFPRVSVRSLVLLPAFTRIRREVPGARHRNCSRKSYR